MERPDSGSSRRSTSSSPVNSDASIDINDDDDDVSQPSSKRESMSSPIGAGLAEAAAVKTAKTAKLSFSISRLLGAASAKHSGSSEGESESPSSLCSQCPSSDLVNGSTAYTSHPDAKGHHHHHHHLAAAFNGARLASMSPYESALSHMQSQAASAAVIRVPAHRPPSMPYTTQFPWLGPTPPTLIKDGLQSELPFRSFLKQNV